jgi:hypothetical protein
MAVTLRGRKGTIVLVETIGPKRRTWRISSGSRSYRALVGGDGDQEPGRSGTQVAVSGSVSNL